MLWVWTRVVKSLSVFLGPPLPLPRYRWHCTIVHRELKQIPGCCIFDAAWALPAHYEVVIQKHSPEGWAHHISLSKACYGYHDLRQRATLHQLMGGGVTPKITSSVIIIIRKVHNHWALNNHNLIYWRLGWGFWLPGKSGSQPLSVWHLIRASWLRDDWFLEKKQKIKNYILYLYLYYIIYIYKSITGDDCQVLESCSEYSAEQQSKLAFLLWDILSVKPTRRSEGQCHRPNPKSC